MGQLGLKPSKISVFLGLEIREIPNGHAIQDETELYRPETGRCQHGNAGQYRQTKAVEYLRCQDCGWKLESPAIIFPLGIVFISLSIISLSTNHPFNYS